MMNAKELREKYGRQVDLADFHGRRPIGVDPVDLCGLLDAADDMEEYQQRSKNAQEVLKTLVSTEVFDRVMQDMLGPYEYKVFKERSK